MGQFMLHDLIILSLCLIEALLIVALVVQYVRRRRAEQAMRESEEHRRVFIAHSTEGIARWEVDKPISTLLPEDEQIDAMYGSFSLMECNDAYANIYGRSKAEDMISLRFGDILDQTDPHNAEYMRVFIRSGYRAEDFESYIEYPAGNKRCISKNLTGVVENGRLLRAWSLHRDVTERRQMQEGLRQAAGEWQTTFDSIKDMVMILDGQYRIVRVNAATISFFNLPQESIIGNYCYSLMHGTTNPFKKCPFSKVYETRKHQETEIHDDEKNAWFLMTVDPIFDDSGAISAVVHTVKDITDRKQADEALRQSEERFRLLISAVEDYVIIMLDPDGCVMSWNAGVERIKGYKAAEIIGRHFSCFYTDEDVADGKPSRVLENARINGRHEDEGWRVRKDGSRFWANVLTTAIKDEAGHLRGFTKVTRDLTERKRCEDTLQLLAGRLLTAQEEERKRFAREMHDDLTQRLAVLAIDAGKLEKELDSSAIVSGKLREMKEQLINLSKDVHTLSRQLHPSILDDLGLVDALRSECNSFAQREEIDVRYTPQNVPADIPKDVALCLYRIAQESLRNIAKHSGSKEACISLAVADDGVLLAIEDTGVGFNPAEARGKQGLGLSSMEERARLIGGDFSIRSESGNGTLIEVWAPLSRSLP
jgi:PAS domain S-box-containing protein